MIEAERTPWTDVAEHLGRTDAPPASRLAVLPFGALEQHGPQLPLGTDTFQAVHVARGIAAHPSAMTPDPHAHHHSFELRPPIA